MSMDEKIHVRQYSKGYALRNEETKGLSFFFLP